MDKSQYEAWNRLSDALCCCLISSSAQIHRHMQWMWEEENRHSTIYKPVYVETAPELSRSCIIFAVRQTRSCKLFINKMSFWKVSAAWCPARRVIDLSPEPPSFYSQPLRSFYYKSQMELLRLSSSQWQITSIWDSLKLIFHCLGFSSPQTVFDAP